MPMRKAFPVKLALAEPSDVRLDLNSIVVQDVAGVPRSGVVFPVGTNLLVGTATMNTQVGAFNAVSVRDGGVVLLANDGPFNVLHDAAPVSGSRIDRVVGKQNDASSQVTVPDADNIPLIYIVKGQAHATSPVAPAIPAGAVDLGTVTIAAGQTSTNAATIAQTGDYTTSDGGTVPFRSVTAMKAWSTARPGQEARILGKKSTYEFSSAGKWVSAQGGLVPVIPTSVAGTGVTKDSDGLVSYTGAGPVSLNGVFTEEFDNYLILIDTTAQTAGGGATLRMRSNGSDFTAGNYGYQVMYQNNTGISAGGAASTSWALVVVGSNEISGRIEFFGPAKAARMRAIWSVMQTVSAANLVKTEGAGRLDSAASFDGFSYIPQNNGHTGTIRVYGYNDNQEI